jgi:hypothetical protein
LADCSRPTHFARQIELKMHLDDTSYVGTHLLPDNVPMPGPEEVEKAT